MERKIINLPNVAVPVAPYSPVVSAGDFLFLSGQVSERNKDNTKPDIATQTKDAMNAIKTLLEGAGSDLDHIVKCNVYLSDRAHFHEMNEVYASFFKNGYPARLCVSRVDIYDDLDVEIDVLALKA